MDYELWRSTVNHTGRLCSICVDSDLSLQICILEQQGRAHWEEIRTDCLIGLEVEIRSPTFLSLL